MEYIEGKELLKQFRKHELIQLMNEKQLTPYSPATLKPFHIYITRSKYQKYKESNMSSFMPYPENPLTDGYLPSAENPFSILYSYLDEVLFDSKEVNTLQKKVIEQSHRAGAGAASKEAGEWKKEKIRSILDNKYGGISGYDALKRGQKKIVLDKLVKETKSKDKRHMYNILREFRESTKEQKLKSC